MSSPCAGDRALALSRDRRHRAPHPKRAGFVAGGCDHATPSAVADRDRLAHGGKDRHPFPVPTRVYDETIRILKSAVQSAKLGRDEELAAIKRLDEQSHHLERTAKGPSLGKFIAKEFDRSSELGGRSVFGWERPTSLKIVT